MAGTTHHTPAARIAGASRSWLRTGDTRVLPLAILACLTCGCQALGTPVPERAPGLVQIARLQEQQLRSATPRQDRPRAATSPVEPPVTDNPGTVALPVFDPIHPCGYTLSEPYSDPDAAADTQPPRILSIAQVASTQLAAIPDHASDTPLADDASFTRDASFAFDAQSAGTDVLTCAAFAADTCWASRGGHCGCGSSSTWNAPRYSFRQDVHDFPAVIWEDAKSICNWNNAALVGGGLATAIGMRQGLDQQIRENTAAHPERWGQWGKVLGGFGEAQYQVACLVGLYAHSLYSQDPYERRFARSLISSFTITGLSTLTIKGIANTDRPSDEWNGGQFGFPSYHTASSTTIAAVIESYYGPEWGVPAYAMAGLISWSRIDERDHDLSDVVFGAALGYVVGKAVAGQHLHGDSRVRLLPYLHPTAGSGVMLQTEY